MQYRSYVQYLSIVFFVLATVGACCWLGWAVAQPPVVQSLPVYQPVDPNVPETQKAPEDGAAESSTYPDAYKAYSSDPLFLEIQKNVLESMRKPSDGAYRNENASIDSISEARWHAVESLLAAARFLEEDLRQATARKDLGAVASTQETIKSLRIQARDMLQPK